MRSIETHFLSYKPILPLVHGSARTEVRLAMRRGNLGHPASARCLWDECGSRAQSSFPVFRARSGARTDEVEFRQENRPLGGFVPAGV